MLTQEQEDIIKKLNDIIDISQELMGVAITGEDGNLREMAYHIKCYSNKIIVHLLKEWKNNIKFAARKEEKNKLKAAQKEEEEQKVENIVKQIFEKFKNE